MAVKLTAKEKKFYVKNTGKVTWGKGYLTVLNIDHQRFTIHFPNPLTLGEVNWQRAMLAKGLARLVETAGPQLEKMKDEQHTRIRKCTRSAVKNATGTKRLGDCVTAGTPGSGTYEG